MKGHFLVHGSEIRQAENFFQVSRGLDLFPYKNKDEMKNILDFKTLDTQSLVTMKDKRYFCSALARNFSEIGRPHWYENMSRVFNYCCRGQLKNFLVCVGTYMTGLQSVRIAVRGSKAQSTGGRAYAYYASMLAQTHEHVLIDLYDVGEQQAVQKYENCTINHISSYYQGRGEGYDVMIDDAYVPGEGVQPFVPVSQYWSLKDHTGDITPFFHHHEGRRFSHVLTLQNNTFSSCNCPLCIMKGYIARLFPSPAVQFATMENVFINLGGFQCQKTQLGSDLSVLSLFTHNLEKGVVYLATPQLRRCAIALKTQLHTPHPYVVGLINNKLKVTQEYVHTRGFKPMSGGVAPDYLQGKQITCVGMSVSELGLCDPGESPIIKLCALKREDQFSLGNHSHQILSPDFGEKRGYSKKVIERDKLVLYSRQFVLPLDYILQGKRVFEQPVSKKKFRVCKLLFQEDKLSMRETVGD